MMSQHDHWQQVSDNAAELYERYLVPSLFAPWAASLVEQAALQQGQRVLDVACGTGVVSRLAAPQVGAAGRVVGLDLTPGMLAVARTLSSPVGALIEWQEGSAEALPFPDASFDVVLCQQGLQFFPDRMVALREMRRVLVPGGKLVLSVWRALQHNLFFATLADALARHVSPEVAAASGAPFTLGEAEELRMLVTGAGFADVRVRIAMRLVRWPQSDDAILVPINLFRVLTAPAGSTVAALNDVTRTALLRDIRTALQSYTDDEGLAVPSETHVVVAFR
jgi:ubiquinone/menaquinone biosynthesis C-methylase UbiE